MFIYKVKGNGKYCLKFFHEQNETINKFILGTILAKYRKVK